MRIARCLAGAIALFAALSAHAETRAVLHAPLDGEVLRGGTRATVSWSAPQLPPFAEEWEAFLSVDGGRYYAFRITPHLDVDLQAFTFEVPNVETEHARILIRVGDERREIELEQPQTLVIRQDHAKALTVGHREVVEGERGEAARHGDRGVIEWIDGSRDGSHLTSRSALHSESAFCATHALPPGSESIEEADPTSVATPLREPSWLPLATVLAPARFIPRHRTGREMLLACRRLNI